MSARKGLLETLTPGQRTVISGLIDTQSETLVKLRNLTGFETNGAFLYFRPIPMPQPQDNSRFFQ
jgi:hypothetical protein